jgi:hypothetical protein
MNPALDEETLSQDRHIGVPILRVEELLEKRRSSRVRLGAKSPARPPRNRILDPGRSLVSSQAAESSRFDQRRTETLEGCTQSESRPLRSDLGLVDIGQFECASLVPSASRSFPQMPARQCSPAKLSNDRRIRRPQCNCRGCAV